MNDLSQFDMVGLAEAIRAKKISAVEVIDALEQRISSRQPKLNCFIKLDIDRARESAKRADSDLAKGITWGPLHAVPLAHKDMYYRAGNVSTAGSKIRRDFRPTHTASALLRLDQAGAIEIGTLNMAEFALNPTGHNEHYGHCRNPWDTNRITGGSSSGSACAVSARLVYGSLGSDTGCSIRLPAAFCGIVGIKPTLTRVSRYGMMPLCHSLDHAGVLTASVRDAATILGLVAGPDGLDPIASNLPVPDFKAALGKGIKGLRIGIPRVYFYDKVDGGRLSALQKSLDVLGDLGAELVDVEMPEPGLCSTYGGFLLQTEGARVHGAWLRSRQNDYSPAVMQRLQAGLALPATRYHESLSSRGRLLQRVLDEVFSKVDLLHIPTTAITPPTMEEADESHRDCRPLMGELTRNTRIFNYLGLPVLNVPCGFDENRMPVGFQLVGKPFADARLFRVGHAYQEATDWHRRLPPN